MRIWITQVTNENGHKSVAFRSKKEAKKYVSEQSKEEYTYVEEPKLYIVKNKDDLIEFINQVADFQV
tara:strand:+ start:198 stop:398 length:201 start_codon:yes stop_codon:yes gene_type:complete